jgi:hypothetical protein
MLIVHGSAWSQTSDLHFAPGWFLFATEHGYYPIGSMRQNSNFGLSNSFQLLDTPVDTTISSFVRDQHADLLSLLPGSTAVLSRTGGRFAPTESALGTEFARLGSAAASLGQGHVWWNLMPEYDHSGGIWSEFRKVDYTSRSLAATSWKQTYQNDFAPLPTYLSIPAGSRTVRLLAVNAHAFSSHYTYELGVDMAVLERVNDEISDLQTGICFIRGAARQFNKPWGIDISTWRAATQTPTTFDNNLKLITGWSPSYIRRHMYLSYMSGANIILNEAAIYFNAGKINPLGQAVLEVADFALHRHPSVGTPDVRTALLMDHDHGFEPKFGPHMQSNFVWYSKIPYVDGDFMTHYVLNLIFPEYWRSATLPPGAPQTPPEYLAALARGEDPRPWEPMGSSRWGDHFDILLSNASREALNHYKNIFLLGGIVLDDALRGTLLEWVKAGGTLMITAGQARLGDSLLTGAVKTGRTARSTESVWISDESHITERSYQYEVLAPRSSRILATTGSGDPLITSQQRGTGEVVMIASPHFIDDARAGLLKVSDRLFDGLLTRGLIASPVGPFPLQFLVTHRADVVIVTLSNNTAQRWQGEIHLNDPMSISTVQDWVADTPLTFSRRPTGTFASLAIDPFDIRIVAFLKSTDSAAERGGALDLLSLSEPYPNPASATTMISLKTLQDCSASVQVYDILGRLVGTLYEGDLAQGSHAFVIPASRLASGSYQIIARTPSDVICRRLLIVH